MASGTKIYLIVAIVAPLLSSCSPERKHLRYKTLNHLSELDEAQNEKSSNQKSSNESVSSLDPSEVFINEVYLLLTGQVMPESLDAITIKQLEEQQVGLIGLASGLMETKAYRETIVARTLNCVSGRVSAKDLEEWVAVYEDSSIRNLIDFLTIFFAAKSTDNFLSAKFKSPKLHAAGLISAVGCITMPWGDQELLDGILNKISAEDLVAIETVIEGEQFAFPFVAVAIAPIVRIELAKYGNRSVALSLSDTKTPASMIYEFLAQNDFVRAFAEALSGNAHYPLAKGASRKQQLQISETPALAPVPLSLVEVENAFFKIEGPSILAPKVAGLSLLSFSGASVDDWQESSGTIDTTQTTDPYQTIDPYQDADPYQDTDPYQNTDPYQDIDPSPSPTADSGGDVGENPKLPVGTKKVDVDKDTKHSQAKKFSEEFRAKGSWKPLPNISKLVNLRFDVVDVVQPFLFDENQ